MKILKAVFLLCYQSLQNTEQEDTIFGRVLHSRASYLTHTNMRTFRLRYSLPQESRLQGSSPEGMRHLSEFPHSLQGTYSSFPEHLPHEP